MELETALTHAAGMTISEDSSDSEIALQTIAAELRRLTTLRPMSEAPTDEHMQIVFDNHDGTDSVFTGYEYHGGWYVVTPNHDDQQVRTDSVDSMKGWLPLPKEIK